MINEFNGQFRFLSNFALSDVTLDGKVYKSVEHAYQAAKTLDNSVREKIRLASSPGSAKRYGKGLKLRPDWENIKVSIMEELLRQKFSQNSFKQKLIDTGNAELIEGNWWGDQEWGVYQGIGKNLLGQLLMKIRDEIKNT